ncbi:MAG: Ig-like domain-containing protein [Balneolaceae bacterium]
MNTRLLYAFFLVAVIAALVSCATPVPPTGGPPDRTPPVIEHSRPADRTINFEGREIRIRFSKFVDRSSLLDAIEVEPDLAINFEIGWRRKTAVIQFDEELPENTTVIIRIGTELQDTRGNNIASPYIIALSTGEEIDDGGVTARIFQAEDGTADSGYRVFLYREPFDLSARANYVAQSDTGGVVEFSYLSADSYKAIWVDDTNRNRTWDWNGELAQPFSDSTFALDRGGEFDLGTIYIDRPETVHPLLQGVGLLTEERLRLRFNEDIYWDDDSVLSVMDSLGNPYTEALPLYVVPEDPLVVIAQSTEPLPEGEYFSLELSGFYDGAGNPSGVRVDPFPGSVQADTVRLRIVGDNTEPGLFPDEPLVIGYNKIIDDEDILDSLRVVEGDEMIEEWAGAETDRHRLRIPPADQWESGLSYQFLAWNPDTGQLRPLEPVIWQRNSLGSIEFVLEDTTGSNAHFLTLYDDQGKVHIDTTFTDTLEIDQLPPLSYTAVVFRDLNRSGTWESGAIFPFQAPEPYFVRRNIPVREGFTSELEISFE